MIRLLVMLILATPSLARECIPFDQAADNIGKTTCVTGKVLKVAQSESGSMFLDFCENYRKCPFVVVVFRSNLKQVGDVRLLKGKDGEITGKIKEWRGRAEIVLKDAGQLDGLSEKLPPIPATYDADHHGNFSAGKYSAPRSKHASQGNRRSRRMRLMQSEKIADWRLVIVYCGLGCNGLAGFLVGPLGVGKNENPTPAKRSLDGAPGAAKATP